MPHILEHFPEHNFHINAGHKNLKLLSKHFMEAFYCGGQFEPSYVNRSTLQLLALPLAAIFFQLLPGYCLGNLPVRKKRQEGQSLENSKNHFSVYILIVTFLEIFSKDSFATFTMCGPKRNSFASLLLPIFQIHRDPLRAHSRSW